MNVGILFNMTYPSLSSFTSITKRLIFSSTNLYSNYVKSPLNDNL